MRELLAVGQLYLNEALNEYLIITGLSRGHVTFAGPGFNGKADSEFFLERFQPVDPQDLEEREVHQLLDLAPADTTAKIGAILEQ